jgi:hypothetical protein
MCLKVEPGNPLASLRTGPSASLRTSLGELKSILVKNKVNGVPPEMKTPGDERNLNLSNEPEMGHEKNRA